MSAAPEPVSRPSRADTTEGRSEARCEANNDALGRCEQPATRTVTVGCVHEHIVKRRVCERHADKTLSGGMFCRACRSGTNPHMCPLLGREALEETHA